MGIFRRRRRKAQKTRGIAAWLSVGEPEKSKDAAACMHAEARHTDAAPRTTRPAVPSPPQLHTTKWVFTAAAASLQHTTPQYTFSLTHKQTHGSSSGPWLRQPGRPGRPAAQALRRPASSFLFSPLAGGGAQCGNEPAGVWEKQACGLSLLCSGSNFFFSPVPVMLASTRACPHACASLSAPCCRPHSSHSMRWVVGRRACRPHTSATTATYLAGRPCRLPPARMAGRAGSRNSSSWQWKKPKAKAKAKLSIPWQLPRCAWACGGEWHAWRCGRKEKKTDRRNEHNATANLANR